MTTHLCDVVCLVCDRSGLGSAETSSIARTQSPIHLPAGWRNAERSPSFAPVCSEACHAAWRTALFDAHP